MKQMKSSKLSRRSLLGILVAAMLTGACGLTTIFKSASAIRDDIQKELGVQANVGINKINGKTIVNVGLAAMPSGDAQNVDAQIRAIVARHIPDAADVRISASLAREGGHRKVE